MQRRLIALALCTQILLACGQQGPQPIEDVAVVDRPMPTTGAEPAERFALRSAARPGNEAPAFRYRLPDGWSQGAATPMRLIDLDAPGDVHCWVTRLSGDGGGLLRNLNRWRGEMGAEPMQATEIADLEQIELLGSDVPLLALHGRYQGRGGAPIDDAALRACATRYRGSLVSVKMVGPAAAVAEQEQAFRSFCASLEAPQ